MEISATVRHSAGDHAVMVQTGEARQSLPIPAKPAGRGSAVNGGEFLMLALATCYCNDLYREAERIGMPIDDVEVEASADFDGVGLAATRVRYRAKVTSTAGNAAIDELLRRTDAVAEVHNTLRSGVEVTRVA